MYVKEYMSTNVVTVRNDTQIYEVEKIMLEHKKRRLPVLDKGGKLIGIITRDKIREIKPSPATSLSIWELNYLLTKMVVKDVMEKNVITVTPDTTIEEAAALGEKYSVGALPVLEKGKLVGIVTDTDLYRVTISALGFGQKGARLHIIDCCKTGPLKEVIDIVNKSGANIRSLFHVVPTGTEREECIVHLDIEDADQVISELKNKGYKVEKR